MVNKRDYDVVVVGAGNAGLMAAITLQKAGKRTLIVEQHNLPGGCASSFVRGRFEFDPSLHELCGLGSKEKPGWVRRKFTEFGLDINWVEVKDCFRAIGKFSDGTPMDVTMPTGKQAFIDRLEEIVPGCRRKVEKLFRLFDEVTKGLEFFSETKDYNVGYAIKTFPNMLIAGSYSADRVFHALKLPQKVIDILAVYWSYLGVDMKSLSFLHYAVMLQDYLQDGAYIPAFTSHDMSVALEDHFRSLGGEIWFNCRAESFLFEGDGVCGVRTSLGDISCSYALANINEDLVYGKMVPKQHVPRRLRQLSNARKQRFSARMFTLDLGLDVTPEQLGIKDYSIFLFDTADSAQEYKNMIGGFETNTFSIFLCYNVVNPQASPKGTTLCSFTTFGSPVDWDDLSPEAYDDFKNHCAEKLISQLRAKTGIDLSGHIEEIAVASPWTFARYLGSPEGCAYGHETTGWDDIVSRTLHLDKDHLVKGLRPMGSGGPRGDGYPTTYQCGVMIAEKALADLEAKEKSNV